MLVLDLYGDVCVTFLQQTLYMMDYMHITGK